MNTVLYAPPEPDCLKDGMKSAARAKLNYNNTIIAENMKTIDAAMIRLRKALPNTDMEEMHVAMAEIQNSIVACRSRLQYMRGVWSMYKDAAEQVAAANGGDV